MSPNRRGPTIEGFGITAQVRSRPTSWLLGSNSRRTSSWPAELQRSHSAVLGKAGLSGQPDFRAGSSVRRSRQPAPKTGRAMGSHVPAAASAGLRTEGREQHRSPGAARAASPEELPSPLLEAGRPRAFVSARHQRCRGQPRRRAGMIPRPPRASALGDGGAQSASCATPPHQSR